MPGPRTGRGRAAKQDPFRDALVAALADALHVAPEALELSVSLDGAPVDAERVPTAVTLGIRAVATAAAASPAPTVDDEDGSDDARAPRGARESGDRSPASGAAERVERSDRSDRGGRDDAARDTTPVTPEELDEEAEAAADLLEGLLDALDLPGDLRISVQDAHAEVEVVGLGEGVLIGRRGQTLEAIQELVRTAMQRRFERRSRVLVDVDGYRARRLERLMERAEEAVREVLATGEPQRLEPMDSIERRLVHQRVASFEGVASVSHGREPARRIVIEPSED